MQLLLLDIMLSTLVTFASAQYTFWVSPEGNIIEYYFRNSNIKGILWRARHVVNCVPLFGLCGPKHHCCADSMGSFQGIPIKQMPPSSPYTIKCSAAEYEFNERYGQKPSYQYTKPNKWVKMFSRNRMNRMNRFCLPKAPRRLFGRGD